MASSPPPQSSTSATLLGSNMIPATGVPVADLATGGGSSSYQVPQFPIERIECKMAAISSRLVYLLFTFNSIFKLIVSRIVKLVLILNTRLVIKIKLKTFSRPYFTDYFFII